MREILRSLGAGAGSRLLVHCVTSIDYLAESFASRRYPERALLLADTGDIVCLTDEVDPAYLELLAAVGLGPRPENVVVASRFSESRGPLWQRLLESEGALDLLGRRMRMAGTAQLHPFFLTKGQCDLARALSERIGRDIAVMGGDPEVVAYADQKHHIRAQALELGIPVAPGEAVDAESVFSAVMRQLRMTGRVIVRGTSGAAGSATFLCAGTPESLADLAVWLSGRTDNSIYLVETMYQVMASPNVQVHVSRERDVSCVGISDQLLDSNLTHTGNAFPSTAVRIKDMLVWATRLGEWLGDMGYAGIAGFDFVEYIAPDGTRQAFLAELNPRVNGATYPLALRERLSPGSAFVSGSIETPLDAFAEVRDRLAHLLYSPARRRGVIPSMPGGLAYGSCGMIALAPTRAEAAGLFAQAELSLAAPVLQSEPVKLLAGIS